MSWSLQSDETVCLIVIIALIISVPNWFIYFESIKIMAVVAICIIYSLYFLFTNKYTDVKYALLFVSPCEF